MLYVTIILAFILIGTGVVAAYFLGRYRHRRRVRQLIQQLEQRSVRPSVQVDIVPTAPGMPHAIGKLIAEEYPASTPTAKKPGPKEAPEPELEPDPELRPEPQDVPRPSKTSTETMESACTEIGQSEELSKTSKTKTMERARAETEVSRAPSKVAKTKTLDRKLEGIRWENDDKGGSDIVARALTIIDERMEEPIAVADLAQRLDMSTRSLQRGIKAALGCSPGDLIWAAKMYRAKRLLETGSYRVSEVAYQLGFEAPEHFSRRFKAYYRVPPFAVIAQRRKQSK